MRRYRMSATWFVFWRLILTPPRFQALLSLSRMLVCILRSGALGTSYTIPSPHTCSSRCVFFHMCCIIWSLWRYHVSLRDWQGLVVVREGSHWRLWRGGEGCVSVAVVVVGVSSTVLEVGVVVCTPRSGTPGTPRTGLRPSICTCCCVVFRTPCMVWVSSCPGTGPLSLS